MRPNPRVRGRDEFGTPHSARHLPRVLEHTRPRLIDPGTPYSARYFLPVDRILSDRGLALVEHMAEVDPNGRDYQVGGVLERLCRVLGFALRASFVPELPDNPQVVQRRAYV